MQKTSLVEGYAVERLRQLWSAIRFFAAAFAGAMVVDLTGGNPPAPSGTEPPSGTPNPSGTGSDPAPNPSGTGGTPPAQPTDWRDAEIEKLRKENAERRVREKQREEEDKKRQADELAKQGEFQKLYEQEKAQREAASKQLEELLAFRDTVVAKEEAIRKTELAKLPETLRPAFETASLEQIQAALTLQAEAVARQQATPQPNANSPAATAGGATDPAKPKSLIEMVQEQMNKK